MLEFQALKADNLDQALDILDEKKKQVKMIAGGTDMLVGIHNESDDLKGIDYLLDISSINGLELIEDKKEYMKLGALCTHNEIINSDLVNERFPLLKKAAGVIGSTQIRNRGTVGGNINNASPAADLVPALIALDAKVVLKSKDQKRELPLSQFITGPYRTDLKENEIIFTFVAESTGIGILGGIFGIILGAVSVYFFSNFGLDFSMFIDIDMSTFGIPIVSKIYGVWNPWTFVYMFFFSSSTSIIIISNFLQEVNF
jgi:hypothetical protein